MINCPYIILILYFDTAYAVPVHNIKYITIVHCEDCLVKTANLPLIHFAPPPHLLIDLTNSKWLSYFCILLCICYCFSHLIGLFSVTWLFLFYKFTRFFIDLSDEGPTLETLDFTIHIGSIQYQPFYISIWIGSLRFTISPDFTSCRPCSAVERVIIWVQAPFENISFNDTAIETPHNAVRTFLQTPSGPEPQANYLFYHPLQPSRWSWQI